MKWKPHDYQVRAVDFIIDNPQAALFLEMGLGKTSAVLTAFNDLKYDMGQLTAMLVVAPLRVAHLVWAQEAAKWDHLQHLRIQVLHGNGKDEVINERADVYVINYDGLKWFQEKMKQRKLPNSIGMVVFDESTMVKNPRAIRSKICRGIAMTVSRRIILTGTPIPNRLLDIWHQIKLLDMGQRLGTAFTHFKNKYFFSTGYGGYKLVPYKGATQEVIEKISDITLTMRAEDYLTMPPRIDNEVEVELPAKHREQYEELEREFFIEVEEKGIEVFNAASLSVKLRQLVQGFIYNTETQEASTSMTVKCRRCKRSLTVAVPRFWSRSSSGTK